MLARRRRRISSRSVSVNLGVLYRDTGRLADADKAFSEALTIYRETSPPRSAGCPLLRPQPPHASACRGERPYWWEQAQGLNSARRRAPLADRTPT